MDCEDGTDNITFSHDIVANHHKSLLLGGGLKERERDIGKMRFTIFGNWFANSDSRNPLMRFGTFYLIYNLFTHDNVSAGLYQRQLEYNLGVYTESSVLIGGNVFRNAAEGNTTRIFSFSTLTNSSLPARVCIPVSESELPVELQSLVTPVSTFNGKQIDLKEDASATFKRSVVEKPGNVVDGALVLGCEGFLGQSAPDAFQTAREVEVYVRMEAGQTTATRMPYAADSY